MVISTLLISDIISAVLCSHNHRGEKCYLDNQQWCVFRGPCELDTSRRRGCPIILIHVTKPPDDCDLFK